MILSYDSVLGIPIVESSGENTNNSNSSNNMGINLGVPSPLIISCNYNIYSPPYFLL